MTRDSRSGQGDPARILPLVARAALEACFDVAGRVEEPLIPADSPLRRPGASFVTLRRGGNLRGCIGTMEPLRPLVDDVRANAVAAARSDPRFPPLEPAELPSVTIDVSVLSEKTPVAFSTEDDLVARLRPGVDGLLLTSGGHRGTFLPAVWDQIADPRGFLRELKRKAGLDRDAWPDDVRVWRYTTKTYPE